MGSRRQQVLAESGAFLERSRAEDLAVRIERVLASAAPGPTISDDIDDPDTGECDWCHVPRWEYSMDPPSARERWWPVSDRGLAELEHSRGPFVVMTDMGWAAQNAVRFPDLYGVWVYSPSLLPPAGGPLTLRAYERRQTEERVRTDFGRYGSDVHRHR